MRGAEGVLREEFENTVERILARLGLGEGTFRIIYCRKNMVHKGDVIGITNDEVTLLDDNKNEIKIFIKNIIDVE